jgi:hypothetical protein
MPERSSAAAGDTTGTHALRPSRLQATTSGSREVRSPRQRARRATSDSPATISDADADLAGARTQTDRQRGQCEYDSIEGVETRRLDRA